MAPQWLPQNIQKRLLKYVLQQLSLFSEIDLPNLDVSLGTNSRIDLRNLELDIEKFNIPGIHVRNGTVKEMTLILTMSDGVNIDCNGLEITVSPTASVLKKAKSEQFSLAKSTADLANSVMFDDNIYDDDDESGKNRTKNTKAKKQEEPNSASSDSDTSIDTSSNSAPANPYKLSNMMAKAADMALSRLQVEIRNVKITIISDPSVVEVQIDSVSFSSNDGIREIDISGISMCSLKQDIYQGEGLDEDEYQDDNETEESDYNDNSDTEEDNSDDDYNDKMMSTSFMAENKEDFHQSLMDSIMFSNPEASSIYMSATSNLLKEPSSANPTDSQRKRSPRVTRLIHIDEAHAFFSGLQSIENVHVELGTIKVAAAPLSECMASLISSISHLQRLYSIRPSTTSNSVSASPPNANNLPTTTTLLDDLTISKIIISLSSAINKSGEFAQDNSIRLRASDINFQQRSSTFSFGSVSKFEIVRNEGNETALFEFEETRAETTDLRFEILKGDILRTTLLCSKVANIHLDSNAVARFIEFSTLLNPLLDAIATLSNNSSSQTTTTNSLSASYYHSSRNPRLPPSYIRDTTASSSTTLPSLPQLPPSSEISAQSSSIYINLKLSERDAIRITILPLSYSSLSGKLETDKIFFEYLNKDYKQGYSSQQFLMVNGLQVKSYSTGPVKVSSWDSNTYQESTMTTSLKTQIENVTFNSGYEKFKDLMESLKSFSSLLGPATSQKPNTAPKATKSAPVQKKVRMGNSVFITNNTKSLNHHISVKNISMALFDVSPQFGDIKGEIDELHINIFKDQSVHVVIMNAFVARYCNGLCVETVVAIANRGEQNAPMIFMKYKGSASIHLRNTALNYYGKWFTLLEEQESEDKEMEEAGVSGSIGPTESESKNRMEIHVTLVDISIGLVPVNLSSKAELVLKKGNAEIVVDSNGNMNIQTSFSSISLLLIDDILNLAGDQDNQKFKDWSSLNKPAHPSWTLLSVLRGKGFAPVATANSMFMNIKVNTLSYLQNLVTSRTGNDFKPLCDLKVNLETLKVDLCADSSQCMLQLFKDLKQPVQFSFDEKYKPDTSSVDIFKDIDDTFYMPNREESVIVDSNPGIFTDDNLESQSELEVVEDFYDKAVVNEDSSVSPESSNNGLAGTKSGSSVDDITFKDDHFKDSKNKDSVPKETIIPMAIAVNVSKIIIHLYDGYDWKETQTTIRKAIKRVEDKARVQMLEKNRFESELDSRFNNQSEDRFNESNTRNGFQTPSVEFDTNDIEENNDIIGEMLYESIHLGFPAGQDPSRLYDSINQSINFGSNRPFNYDLDENITSERTNASPASPASIRSSNSNSKSSTPSHNIELGRASGKRLRLKRSKFHKIAIEAHDLDFDMKIYNNSDPHPKEKPVVFNTDEDVDDSELLSRMDIRVGTFQIMDKVPTSTWNMFVGYLREAGDREVGASMLHMVIDTVRPVPELAASELVLSVSVLPLRLYVDQDTLDFLTRFGEFKDDRFVPPITEDDEIFIEKLKVNAVKIKLDYKPKKVDYAGIRSGHTTEFMNFFILDESEMILQKVVLYGIPGFSRLNKLLNDSWMPDIKRNQLGGILAGLAPVKSVVKIGSGFKDLLVVPIREYQKDGRVMRSLQKGAYSFARTTGGELLKFGVKLAAGTQNILETTEEALGGDGSSARLSDQKKVSKKPRRSSNGSESIYAIADKRSPLNNMAYRRSSFDSFGDEEDDTYDCEIDPQRNRHENRLNFKYHHDNNSDLMESDSDTDNDYYNETEFDDEDQKIISLYSNQPQDLNQGLRTAYRSLGKNFGAAKDAMMIAGSKATESGSAQIAFKEIAKATPILVIRPIIGTTEAISKALMGGINLMDPEERKKSEQKYKILK